MTFLFDVLHNRADYGEYIACYPELLARSATPEDARRRMRAFAVEEVKSVDLRRLVGIGGPAANQVDQQQDKDAAQFGG